MGIEVVEVAFTHLPGIDVVDSADDLEESDAVDGCLFAAVVGEVESEVDTRGELGNSLEAMALELASFAAIDHEVRVGAPPCSGIDELRALIGIRDVETVLIDDIELIDSCRRRKIGFSDLDALAEVEIVEVGIFSVVGFDRLEREIFHGSLGIGGRQRAVVEALPRRISAPDFHHRQIVGINVVVFGTRAAVVGEPEGIAVESVARDHQYDLIETQPSGYGALAALSGLDGG